MIKDVMEMAHGKQRPISFHFHPNGFDEQSHAIEKAEGGGARRRYLRGIASGLTADAHGERMSEKAVNSFMEQANSGDILLYADVHGIKFTEDIGILTKAEILPTGDWYTEYRLYDKLDGVDQVSVEVADKLWKQVNGLPPYKHPRQKGFSIEGFVPEGDGLIQMGEDGRQVINEVKLDGVVVVPRPAYKDSIAHSVYKALGVEAPWNKENTIASRLKQEVVEAEERESYYRRSYQISDATDQLIRDSMVILDSAERRARLEEIYDEYKYLMIDLILSHPNAFSADEISLDQGAVETKVAKSNLLKGLLASMKSLEEIHGVAE